MTCANYMWEILGWACFNVATQSAVGIAFNLVGAAQMVQWALAKHARRVAGGWGGCRAMGRRSLTFASRAAPLPRPAPRRLRRTFDGKDGRAKYPRRWVILPPFL